MEQSWFFCNMPFVSVVINKSKTFVANPCFYWWKRIEYSVVWLWRISWVDHIFIIYQLEILDSLIIFSEVSNIYTEMRNSMVPVHRWMYIYFCLFSLDWDMRAVTCLVLQGWRTVIHYSPFMLLIGDIYKLFSFFPLVKPLFFGGG